MFIRVGAYIVVCVKIHHAVFLNMCTLLYVNYTYVKIKLDRLKKVFQE